jgi:hypothetical protein
VPGKLMWLLFILRPASGPLGKLDLRAVKHVKDSSQMRPNTAIAPMHRHVITKRVIQSAIHVFSFVLCVSRALLDSSVCFDLRHCGDSGFCED